MAAGILDLRRKFMQEELTGDNVMFAATGLPPAIISAACGFFRRRDDQQRRDVLEDARAAPHDKKSDGPDRVRSGPSASQIRKLLIVMIGTLAVISLPIGMVLLDPVMAVLRRPSTRVPVFMLFSPVPVGRSAA